MKTQRLVGLGLLFSIASVLLSCSVSADEPPRLLVDIGADSPDYFAFSSDGKFLASCGGVMYQIWDMATGKQVNSGMADYARTLALLNHGKTLVIPASGDVTIHDLQRGTFHTKKDVGGSLFHLADQTCILKEEQEGYRLYSVPDFHPMGHIPVTYSNPTFALSSSGRYLFARDESAKHGEVWDFRTGKRVAILSGVESHPVVFGLKGDQRWLFVRDNQVHVWNQRLKKWEGKPTKFKLSFSSESYNNALHPNEKWIATAANERDTLVLFDITTGKIRFQQHLPSPDFFQFSPDGKWLAVRSYPSAYVFDVATGKVRYHLLPQSTIKSFSRDGKMALFSSEEGVFQVRNLATGTFWNLPKGYKEASMTPNAKWVLMRTDNELSVWSVEARRFLYKLPCQDHSLMGGFLQVTANDSWLALYHEGFSLYEIASGKKVALLPFDEDGLIQRQVASTRWNNKFVEIDGDGDTVSLIPKYATKAKVSNRILPHLYDLKFSPNNRLLLGWDDTTLYAMRLPDVKMTYFLGLHKHIEIIGAKRYFGTMVFHPSEKFFLEGIGGEWNIPVRDSETGTLKTVLKKFGIDVPQFSPDGKYLISIARGTRGTHQRVILRDGNTLSVLRTLLKEDCYKEEHLQKDAIVDHLESILPNNRVLVTFDSCRSYSYWSIPGGKLLGTLYPCPENEYLFVTPDGRYDGSKQGIERLYWVRQGQAFPRQAFPGTKYVPGLFAQILSQ